MFLNGHKMEHYKHPSKRGAVALACVIRDTAGRVIAHRRVERAPWTHTVLQESPGCGAAGTATSVTLGVHLCVALACTVAEGWLLD
jgi:hypothetical protein